ncbi:MAG: hypothetical protein ABEJ55_05520 [Halanaeroarchaeum sp.]
MIAELEDVAQNFDLHAAAASTVLSPREFYTVENPYGGAGGLHERPAIGLDDGKTDGIVLANAPSADAFLTDEFGSTNFALIHAILEGPRLVPNPRLIRDYALAGHVSAEDARAVIERIGTHRSWDGSPYVERLFDSS